MKTRSRVSSARLKIRQSSRLDESCLTSSDEMPCATSSSSLSVSGRSREIPARPKPKVSATLAQIRSSNSPASRTPWADRARSRTAASPGRSSLISTLTLLGAVLPVPVIERLRSDHHADAAEVGLVRARVVDDVGAAVARAVSEHRQPALAGPESVRNPGCGRTGDNVTAMQRVLFVAEQSRSRTVEDHEDLLFDGMAVRGSAEHARLDPVVVDPGEHRAGSDPEVAVVDEHVATAPVLLLALVDVDDPLRPGAWLRQLGIAERKLLRPLMRRDHVRPEHSDAARLQAGEERVLRRRARAEGEIVDPLLARDDRVRLGAREVDKAIAGSNLVDRLAVAVVLPREARAVEHEEDLLLTALHVQRCRARAGIHLHALDADRDAAGGPAEIGPGGLERALRGPAGLDVFPVHHVLGHRPIRPWVRLPRHARVGTARVRRRPVRSPPVRSRARPRPRAGLG